MSGPCTPLVPYTDSSSMSSTPIYASSCDEDERWRITNADLEEWREEKGVSTEPALAPGKRSSSASGGRRRRPLTPPASTRRSRFAPTSSASSAVSAAHPRSYARRGEDVRAELLAPLPPPSPSFPLSRVSVLPAASVGTRKKPAEVSLLRPGSGPTTRNLRRGPSITRSTSTCILLSRSAAIVPVSHSAANWPCTSPHCEQRWRCSSVSTIVIRGKVYERRDCRGHMITCTAELIRHIIQSHLRDHVSLWACPHFLCRWRTLAHLPETCFRSPRDHAFLCNDNAKLMHLHSHLGFVSNAPGMLVHEFHLKQQHFCLRCVYCHMQRFNHQEARYTEVYDESFALRLKVSAELAITQRDIWAGRGKRIRKHESRAHFRRRRAFNEGMS